MRRLLLVALALLALPIAALEITTHTMTLTEAEVQECIEEGGCTLISRQARRILLERATATECRGVKT